MYMFTNVLATQLGLKPMFTSVIATQFGLEPYVATNVLAESTKNFLQKIPNFGATELTEEECQIYAESELEFLK